MEVRGATPDFGTNEVAKVMFLHLSVILFTGRLPQCMLGCHPRDHVPPGPGTHPWDHAPPGTMCPLGPCTSCTRHTPRTMHPPWTMHPQDHAPPRTMHPPRDQAHPPGPGSPQNHAPPGTRHTPRPCTPQDQAPLPPGDGYCCGRYLEGVGARVPSTPWIRQ